MTSAIEIKVPTRTCTTLQMSAVGQTRRSPTGKYTVQSMKASHVLIPEIQAWLDDGRVIEHQTNRLDQPFTSSFFFNDPALAIQFKLIYG